MAGGASTTVVAAFLDSILNGVSPASYGPVYVQLHTGDPGSAGTANVAGNNTRVSAGSNPGFGAGASVTNLNAINWSDVPDAETYTYITLWSAATSGTFIASGTITANPVNSGDNFSIPVGDMTISLPVAS